MADARVGFSLDQDAFVALTEIMALLGPGTTAREAMQRALGTELYLLKRIDAGDTIAVVRGDGNGMDTINLRRD